MNKRIFTYSVLVGLVFWTSLLQAKTILVSIEPEIYFVQAILGKSQEVAVMIPKGVNPHVYSPKPAQLKKMAASDGYLAIGLPFEKIWLKRFQRQNKKLQVFYLDKGIKKYPLEQNVLWLSARQVKTSNPQELDPHIWLGLSQAKQIAQNTCLALSSIYPQKKQLFQGRLRSFLLHLDDLQKSFARRLAHLKQRSFLVFHPSWGYFARNFALEQLAIEVKGREPTAKELARLIAEIQKKHLKVLITSPEFSARQAQTIVQRLGLNLVRIDPLAQNLERSWQKLVNVLVRNNE